MFKNRQKQKTADFNFEIKSITEDGVFTGYGSVFDVVDYGNDIVKRGAFKRTLAELSSSGRKLPILWQHQSSSPIGVYTKLQEDDYGLLVEGSLLVNDVQLAKEAHALMKAGAVTGLSIGYGTKKSLWDEEKRTRSLLDLDLYEISPVTFPMNDDARVESVKNAISRGELPATVREFEKFLRDAGFSKTNAAKIATSGIKDLLQRESESEETEAAGIVEALKGFSIPTFSI